MVILMTMSETRSIEETLAILSDPALLRSLSEADAELARGEGEDQQSLAAAMQARSAPA